MLRFKNGTYFQSAKETTASLPPGSRPQRLYQNRCSHPLRLEPVERGMVCYKVPAHQLSITVPFSPSLQIYSFFHKWSAYISPLQVRWTGTSSA